MDARSLRHCITDEMYSTLTVGLPFSSNNESLRVCNASARVGITVASSSAISTKDVPPPHFLSINPAAVNSPKPVIK